MRIVVIKTRTGQISCIPMKEKKEYYLKKYNVLSFVNRLWNPYHVNLIKKYYNENVVSGEN